MHGRSDHPTYPCDPGHHHGPKFAHNPITRLNAILHRSTHVYFDRILKPYGLSFTHLRMLAYISHAESARQEDVRAHLGGDKGGVAHGIRKLTELGYVSREPHPDDGRACLLRATDEGWALLGELAEYGRTWSDRMIEGLSADEQRQAEELLQRMVDNACFLLGEECEASRR